jgi:lipopolysaccharide transport system ATP-binding protein
LKPVVRVRNLGKKFKRYPIRWNRLLEWATANHVKLHEEHWALRGISFEVQQGESIGIIGQNGAGKSTLLKIITGTTQPTEGEFEVNGRVAAILELGMGFHPDFTGAENAVMGLQVLGLSPAEIQESLPRVIEFSELGDFIEQPLRTYSSGMHVRLAFSVASAVRPELLIVDEALSVGDAYFQHKSMKRIREFSEQGTTLLFVSHDPGAVKTLCDRAMLLEAGVKIKEGTPDAILDYYNALIAKREKDAEIWQIESDQGRLSTRSGDGRAEILSVEILDSDGNPTRAFRVGDTSTIRCRFQLKQELEKPTIGILIRDRLGNDIFGTNTFHLQEEAPKGKPGEILEARFEAELNLGYGNYSLSVAVHARQTHLEGNYDWWDQVLVFQVVPGSGREFVGSAALPCEVKWDRS